MPSNFGSNLGTSFTPGQQGGNPAQLTPGASEALKIISLRLPAFLGGAPIAPTSLLQGNAMGSAGAGAPSDQMLARMAPSLGPQLRPPSSAPGAPAAPPTQNFTGGSPNPMPMTMGAPGAAGGVGSAMPSAPSAPSGGSPDLFALIQSVLSGSGMSGGAPGPSIDFGQTQNRGGAPSGAGASLSTPDNNFGGGGFGGGGGRQV